MPAGKNGKIEQGMDMDNKEEKKIQPYEKPRLRVIELTAEEVLAVGCKTAAGGAPLPPNCLSCGGNLGS
jgi:hypothetical protein